jgi:enoyl-CoA hydratase/carnithine racemase
MENSLISIEKAAISRLVLRRPGRKNALSYALLDHMHTALLELETSECRALIIASEGNVFCSGHDFGDLAKASREEMHALVCLCSKVMQKLHHLPFPTIASVQGGALGAGCQLALSCDLVIAATESYFQTPGGTGGWFCTTPGVAVARSLAPKRALEMLLLGLPVSATQALEWGMINRVVNASDLAAAATQFAELASKGSRSSKSMGKAAFYQQHELEEAAAYGYASEVMAESAFCPDAQENFRAFVEKRKPQFSE